MFFIYLLNAHIVFVITYYLPLQKRMSGNENRRGLHKLQLKCAMKQQTWKKLDLDLDVQ